MRSRASWPPSVSRWRNRRTTWLVPLLFLAFVVLTVIGLDFATRRHWLGLPNGYFVASAAIGWLVNVLLLAVVVLSSFAISQEFAIGTIRSSWIRPISRRAWFAGKVLTACGVIAFLFLMAAGVAVLIVATKLGFADLMENNFMMHSSSSLAGRLVVTILLTLWALWAVTVVMTAVASLFGHPGGAIATGLGIGVLFTALAIFPPMSPFLLTTFVASPMEQMTAMAKGLPLPYEWGSLVGRTLIGGGIWMLIGAVLGDRIIARKQITS